MNVDLICLGKLKEQYLRDACAEYEKRLRAFCRLYIVQLTPAPLPEDPSPAQIERALSAEAEMIKSKIAKGAAVITLCVEGRQCTSPGFAELLQQSAQRGGSNVAFIIGSSYGLSEEIKKLSHFRLSMSEMTFPHQLARVMLLEQIYRGFQIQSNGKYHK